MNNQKLASANRRGFSLIPLVWLLACLAAAGVLLTKGLNSPATIEASVERPTHTKAIEDVKTGDRVWAYDPRSGQWSPKQVIKPLVHNYTGDLVTVTVAGHSVEATGNHPFWVVGGEELSQRPEPRDVPEQDRHPIGAIGRWVDARHLEAGDVLVLRDGRAAPTEMVTVRQASTKVYNIQVADLHTYAVGDLGIAVHNKPCFPPGTPVLMGDGTTKAIEKVQLGDWVMSKNQENQSSPCPMRVSALFRDLSDCVIEVSFHAVCGGGTVVATPHHPFWTANRGWTEAYKLSVGDILKDNCDRDLPVTVARLNHRIVHSYNLTVANNHTYFVVANGSPILVHNGNADFPVGSTITVDPWEVQLSHPNVSPNSTFSNGPLAGQTVQQVAEGISLNGGTVPNGLSLNVGVANDGALIVAENNRTIVALQEANVASVEANIVNWNNIKVQMSGGTGQPVAPEDLAFRSGL